MTVPAGESVEVPFAITVPADATPGDHVGRIFAGRTSLPVRLRVGGALKPSLAVENVKLDGDTVTYTLHNTGNAILGARAAVSVSGPFGSSPGRTTRGAAALLPGERRKVSARLRVARVVRLTAKVEATPLLTDAAGSTAPRPAVSATGHAWVIPWLPVFALLAVGALVATVLRPRRRLARR